MEREESHFFLFYKGLEGEKKRRKEKEKQCVGGRRDRREIAELITQTK